jgi:bacterioferritin-associated ferredoxin
VILCVCGGVPEQEILDLIKQGYNLQQLLKETAVSKDCGICLDSLKVLMKTNSLQTPKTNDKIITDKEE